MISKIIFKCISFAETICAYLQGKGYGAASIKQEIQLALKLLDKSPALIIDIGGSLGNYTQECLNHFPNAEIHIFEPSAKSASALKTRFQNKDHVHVIPSAVSDTSGSSVLFANDSGSALSSLTKRRLDHFNLPFDFQETVTTVRFEDYWTSQLQKRPIDLVKIDIEGHEFSALQGFGAALAATKVIQFEFGGCNIDTRTFFQDFWYFFTQHNFALYRITPLGLRRIRHYREKEEFFSTTNYLALNSFIS